MVLNFRDVKRAVKERVVQRVDHHDLDEVVGGLTTAENLCYWIASQLLPEFGAALHRNRVVGDAQRLRCAGAAELAALLQEAAAYSVA